MSIDKQRAFERVKKQYKYIAEYQKENYKRITLLLRPEDQEKITQKIGSCDGKTIKAFLLSDNN